MRPALAKRMIILGCSSLVTVVIASVVIGQSGVTDSGPTPALSAAAAIEPGGTNPFRTGRTLVIPHGGGDGLFPENTMVAYDATMAMGADAIDVDLRLSSDGVVIAFHDPSVERITGTRGNVGDMTYAQLATLDAGYNFIPSGTDLSNDEHPYRGKGVTIPTLESILDRFPTTLLSLDLKDEGLEMVEPVCELLRGRGRRDDVFVGSNSDPQIIEFRARCPDVRTSAIMQDVYASRDARATDDPDFVPAVTVDQPPFRVEGRQIVDADSLAWAHEHGVAILTWVVNDTDDMKVLVDLGVDGIYTSYPDRLLALLGRCRGSC